MTSSTDSGPKKRKRSKSISKSSGFLMFPRPFRILALCKRCRRLRQSHVSPRQKSQYTGGSQSPSSSEKGPLVPCGTNQQRSINLNEKQMKEALLSARYALNKYSATEGDDAFLSLFLRPPRFESRETPDTNVVFGKLLSASATLDEEEECNSYSMTIEASDKRLYDAHVLYKMGKEEMFECFFIRPTNSCS
ncbi:hypothetical protein TIFTF001_053367 [Ficus carica]|uniref:Uncharacterized protein n=1 Tax=Ficus carica TaxID=3494 RepID=A0AA88EBH4_FICCA|nr:hypothetical protein TIFTF001_053367 [Ficus carica]